jgi:hypothetical protein
MSLRDRACAKTRLKVFDTDPLVFPTSGKGHHILVELEFGRAVALRLFGTTRRRRLLLIIFQSSRRGLGRNVFLSESSFLSENSYLP